MLLVFSVIKCVTCGLLQKCVRTQHSQAQFRHFRKYWPSKLVNNLLNEDKLVEGRLLFATHNAAFVVNPSDGQRILIFGKNINRALPNDIVAVKLRSVLNWRVRASFEETFRDPVSSSPSIKPIIPSEAEEELPDSLLDADFSDGNAVPQNAPAGHFQLSPGDSFSSASMWPSLREFVASSPHLLPKIFPNENSSEFETGYKFLCSLVNITPFKPLPSPHIVRTGSIVLVLRRDFASRRIIGSLSFEPTVALPSVFISSEESSEYLRSHIDHSEDHNGVSTSSNLCCFLIPERLNLPKVRLAYSSVPADLWKQPHKAQGVRFVCQILDWVCNSMHPHGILLDKIGDPLEIEPATKTLLISHGIREDEFTSDMLRSLPASEEEFCIPNFEYRRRQDFRSNCIFSVDPSTAKDVDDALHVSRCDSKTFKVGVHIADVSYFVRPGSLVDREAADRTTSVYLVQRVIPMLPPILSEALCSLNQGKERLTFSVLLTVNENGEIIDESFARSIIRSCAKLSYEDANDLLETSFENLHSLQQRISPSSPFTLTNIKKSLYYLNMLAQKMRQRRIDNGALLLDKVELQFDLAPKESILPESEQSECCSPPNWPRGYQVKQRGPMHHMIEEWMLAANQAVARRIYSDAIKKHTMQCPLKGEIPERTLGEVPSSSPPSPSRAGRRTHVQDSLQTRLSGGSLLRRHPPPKTEKMSDLVYIAEAAFISMDTSSAGLIRASIKAYTDSLISRGFSEDQVNYLSSALSYLTYMRMQMALYFSLDDIISRALRCSKLPSSSPPAELPTHLESSLLMFSHHFGLNVPLYTHFTSPIRRYADLLVHRQLAKILNTDYWSYCLPKPLATADQVVSKTSPSPPLRIPGGSRRLTVQAALCNKMRQETRRLQEENQNLFLAAFIKASGPMIENGVILEYGSGKIKILIPTCGLIINSNLSKFCSSASSWHFIEDAAPPVSPCGSNSDLSSCFPISSRERPYRKRKLVVKWIHDSSQEEETILSVFSLCSCRLSCSSVGFFIKAELLPPDEKEPEHFLRQSSTG